MGYAIAGAAQAHGHEVVLVSGPVAIEAPVDVRLVKVETAAEMLTAVQDAFAWCEALVMSAAVADWRPQVSSDQKIKKANGMRHIVLEPTDDILKAVSPHRQGKILVGFAAETEDLVKHAERKLQDKGLDLVVANDVSRDDIGFDSEDNQVTLVSGSQAPEALPLMSKQALGGLIIEWLEQCSASSS
jgi:phosphopantothenoylcysteine decarboxylase/phosphopantothenate--cysteine ligase